MPWNWQLPNWPNFTYDPARLIEAERQFALKAGQGIGLRYHLSQVDMETLRIELMCKDALDTSAIEGEALDRDSIQSSIRRQLGLPGSSRRAGAAEAGIAEMMVDLSRRLEAPLTAEILCNWHAMLTQGRRDLDDIGRYRRHADAMQIVSGIDYTARVHFEAPPSAQVPKEMERLIEWLEGVARQLPPITRAGMAHLWFESIHPFEDGNGRIGRAMVEHVLANSLPDPALMIVSPALLKRRSAYYKALEQASRTLDITAWLDWFAEAALAAQQYNLDLTAFILRKSRMMQRLQGRLNARQEKALLRMFATGPDGFIGGLSAANYRSITGAPPATATRDLAELVELGALERRGELKSTRYYLPTGSQAAV